MSLENRPLVSVVIPCFNQGHFLSDSIESILSQTYSPTEIIVVDDGSTDDTPTVASRYSGIRLIRQDNRGLARARNAGFAKALGEYVIFLDADDRLLPNAIDQSVDWLQSHPETAFVSGLCRFIDDEGQVIQGTQPAVPASDRFAAQLSGGYIWMPGTVTFRKTILEKVGGFDQSLRAAEDHDMYLRIAKIAHVHELDEMIGEYRQHQSSMSRDAGRMLKYQSIVLLRHKPPNSGAPATKSAYLQGREIARNYYGGLLVDQVDADRRAHRYWQALRGTLTLLRWHLSGFLAIVRGAKASNKLTFVISEDSDPPTQLTNESLSDPPSGLLLEAMFPRGSRVGGKFNQQPNGDSAISLKCRHAQPTTVVVFGNTHLKTTVETPAKVTALVPDDLLRRAGTYSVYLRTAR